MNLRSTANLFKDLIRRTRFDKEYRLSSSNTALIIIDVQEKLIKAIEDREELVSNIRILIEASKLLDLEIFITEQNPQKLGLTIEKVAELTSAKRYSKFNFSCINSKSLINSIKAMGIKNIIIAGIESHICVLQSALDLNSYGFNIHVINDAIRSRNNLDHQVAIQRMLNSGITISTTETVIFEICETSSRKEFKTISQLIKSKPKAV